MQGRRSQSPVLDAPETPDLAVLIAERQLRPIQELSEIGIDLVPAPRDNHRLD